ncbi:hypothetical protein IE53DRAFT_387742 [Violaceomyces palustris]|uniref:Uncharacterized protein n=1 Tax=Violaceomyces palustris TaxID=1673888 RepID=A0ACD0NW13_9BASI|nr:hypothetical protein IE53DRAFT_387742 [Violaceomyces palustris]
MPIAPIALDSSDEDQPTLTTTRSRSSKPSKRKRSTKSPAESQPSAKAEVPSATRSPEPTRSATPSIPSAPPSHQLETSKNVAFDALPEQQQHKADSPQGSDSDSSVSEIIYSTDSEPPGKGVEFYTSSEGSLHDSDSDPELGSWTERDQKQWQGSNWQLDEAYGGNFDVTGIMRHRLHPRRGHLQYRVLWGGYPIYSSTWEPEHNFDDPSIISDYWSKLGGRPPDLPPVDLEARPPSVHSSDTEIAQYRRPRQKAHEALRKLRREIRKDKKDAKRVLDNMTEEELIRKKKAEKRFERYRKKAQASMDTASRRALYMDRNEDSEAEEDHGVGRTYKIAAVSKTKLKRQEKQRKRQEKSSNKASVIASGRLTLPNVSMRTRPSAPAGGGLKARARDLDAPLDDTPISPRPLFAGAGASLTARQAPQEAKGPSVPGGYKGKHHQPPKTIVLPLDEQTRRMAGARPNPTATPSASPWDLLMQDVYQKPQAKPKPTPSVTTSTRSPGSAIAPSRASAAFIPPPPKGPPPVQPPAPSAAENPLVARKEDSIRPPTLLTGPPLQPKGSTPSITALAPRSNGGSNLHNLSVPVAIQPPLAGETPDPRVTTDPRRRPQGVATSAAPAPPAVPASPVVPINLQAQERVQSLLADGVSGWCGVSKFVMGDDQVSFASALHASDRARERLGDVSSLPKELLFDRAFPMPFLRDIVEAKFGLAAEASQIMAKVHEEEKLYMVSQRMKETDLALVSKVRPDLCLVAFSNMLVEGDLNGLPSGFRPLLGPQMYLVIITSIKLLAPSKSFFPALVEIEGALSDQYESALRWHQTKLDDKSLTRHAIARAKQAASRYNLSFAMGRSIAMSYNLIFTGTREGGAEYEEDAIRVSVNIFQGGIQFHLNDSRSQKLLEGKGKPLNVFIRNASRSQLISNSIKLPLCPYLRRLKRLPHTRFYTYGFSEEVTTEQIRPAFPPTGAGLVSFTFAGIMVLATRSATAGWEGVLDFLTMIPKGWKVVLHPWIRVLYQLIVSEDRFQEVVEGLELLEEGGVAPLEMMDDFETQLDLLGAELSISETTSVPFEEPSRLGEEPIKLIKKLDLEILSTLQKLQIERMDSTRFEVLVADTHFKGAISEAENKGVEILAANEAEKGKFEALKGLRGN